MPDILQRLGKLSKSGGSFCIRCGLGWVLGGLAGTFSSWAVPEENAKNFRKNVIFGYTIKTTNCRPGHFYTFYSWQLFEIFVLHSQDPKLKTLFFYFSKCWLFFEIQGFKVTPLLHVQSKVPIVRPGNVYTFYSWQMFDIFLLYSEDPKLKTLLFFKMLIRCWDTRVQNYPTSASKIKSTNCLAWPHLYFLFMADGWNFCGLFLRP